MDTQLKTLRRLAYQYRDLAGEERYVDNIALHRRVNDNAMARPVVLIEELPWHEMDFDGSLTPVCQDPFLQSVEITLRRALFRHKHFPADMVLPPFIAVKKVVTGSGIGNVGIQVDENTIATDERNHIIAHEYHDQLATEADLEKLTPPVIRYDKEETMRRWQLAGDVLGDILPIRLTGEDYIYVCMWDDIARYRGVTNLLIDLAERPEFTHRLMEKLTSFEESRLAQYEEQDLLDPHPWSLHCTAAIVSDLPGGDYDGVKATRKDIWGRGMAQIFASVSPAMHEEFDIPYMQRVIGTCGLSYYGCCEPLDKKIHIIEKLKNLRKVGLTPWADPQVLCEAVSGRYVVSVKPNPAAVAVPRVDVENVRGELTAILDACRRHGCSCDVTLKDISTCLSRPENIFEWERTAMEVVRNY